MVGFDGELLEIKERLCEASSKLQIIPIVGMGGIGKTTLAKITYEDPLIVQHFDVRAWVTVSQNYHAREILLGILRPTRESNVEIFEDNDILLAQRVYKSLKGRRYIIVMDDLWSTDAWDDVKRIFPDDNNGSRILVTTRLSDVAVYTDSSNPIHQMQFMDVDDSWNLLREKVFGEKGCPLDLEEIGKTIAKNCRGLPLAIVVIGGILSKVNQTRSAWKKIARNVNAALSTGDVPFTRILSLSYDHLPHHLKPCFLYIGNFPEDYEIHVSKLIKLWVAEGFLTPSESKSLEEVAEYNLEDLVKRNLVLVIKKRPNGKIKTVRIHDLLRDLCLTKSEEENFFHHFMDKDANILRHDIIKNIHRLSVSADALGPCPYADASSIHTMLYFNKNNQLLFGLENFMRIKLLDALTVHFDKFPDQVVELFRLRYLAFTNTCVTRLELPISISKLQNLQTLIICPPYRKCISKDNVYLPFEVWSMPELRHLVLLHRFLLPDPSTGADGRAAASLTNLQTLARVENFRCNESVLELIPNLKKLGIYYSGSETGWSDYHLNNLVYFRQLEELNFMVYSCFGDPNPSPLLKSHAAFPISLKKLTLRNCKVSWNDMSTMVGSLPNLEVFKLREFACEGDEWETNEGGFCKLKMLYIEATDLCHWIVESWTHFPRLEHLVLYWCYELREIPSGIGEVPTLRLIELDDYNESVLNSAKGIQEEQLSIGNDDLKVRCRHLNLNKRMG